MSRFSVPDIGGGLLIVVIAGLFAAGAAGYPLGTLNNPGPGVFPLAISVITGLLGLGIAIKGFLGAGEAPVAITHRSVAAVIASVAAFALMIRPFGLIPTLFVVVLLAALGSGKSRPLPSLAVAATTAIGCWLIFVVGLGLPIAAIRIPF